MAEEQTTPAPPEDKPVPDAPPADKASETPEYLSEGFDPTSLPDELQTVYKSMQGDYTRKTQDLAREREQAQQATALYEALQDPERQADALRYLGLEMEQEPPSEPPDPQFQDPRVDQLLEAEQQRAQQAEVDRMHTEITGEIDRQTKPLGLDKDDKDWVYSQALTTPPRPDGLPDIERAVREFQAMSERQYKRYMASKRAPQPPSGQQGSRQVDLNNKEERVQWMAAKMQAEAENNNLT